MKIVVPDKLKCGAYIYDLRMVKDLVVSSNQVGERRPHYSEIVIDEVLHPQQRDVTLLHEYIHLVDDVYVLHLEEDDIDRLAMGFMEFLQSLGIELEWHLAKPT
jgi:hypothetical protein